MSNFPIIGICGPAHSGKDLVADWFNEKNNFVKVAFADVMKRFVREIFDSSFDTLWGPSELREAQVTYAYEDWFSIISKAMKAFSPFLNEVVVQGDRIRHYLTLSEWVHDIRKMHEEHGHLTMREILQTLGTEWGRRKVDPLIWVNYLYDKVIPNLRGDEGHLIHQYAQDRGHFVIKGHGFPRPTGVIIPDHRFLNEIHATQSRGGYCILLRRLALALEGPANVGIKDHQSEMEIRDIPDSEFDLVLELPEGIENVHARLAKVYEDKAWEIKRKVSSAISSPQATSSA